MKMNRVPPEWRWPNDWNTSGWEENATVKDSALPRPPWGRAISLGEKESILLGLHIASIMVAPTLAGLVGVDWSPVHLCALPTLYYVLSGECWREAHRPMHSGHVPTGSTDKLPNPLHF